MASTFHHVADATGNTEARVAEPVWEVRLFGTFRVRAPDGSEATPIGRKARALLAYLVLADGETVSRDRLAGLLWSERGDDQARASLRQALYEMRVLSTEEHPPLLHDRGGARVVVARMTSDCRRIELAVEAGSGETLVTLIGDRPADLLADLDGIDPAFDEWLAAERVRRHGARRRQVLAAGEGALTQHDPTLALRLATRLLASDATDEAAARLAMRASHRCGDRDAVRQAFAQVRDALRTELAAQPAEETSDLHRELMVAEMLPRPLVEAPLERAANDEPLPSPFPSGAQPSSARPDSAPNDLPPRLRRRPLVIGLSCVTAVVVASAIAYAWMPTRAGSSIRTLQVQPLEVATADSAAQALRIGLSAEVARFIVGNDATVHVVDPSANQDSSGPGFFQVGGDARSDAGLLHGTVRLSRASGGAILWSASFVRPVAEVDALREEMASKVGDVSLCALGRHNPNGALFGPEALRLLFAACEQIHLVDVAETTKLFRQLLDLQPDFAHGWGMLAAGEQIASFENAGAEAAALAVAADRDAHHALKLDAHDGEAYYALALGREGNARWLERMDLLTRGHALDPSNGQLDNHIGNDLQDVGRWREAESFHQQAVSADPFGVFKIAGLAQVRGFGDDTAGAIAALLTARKRFGKHRAVARQDLRFQALIGDPRLAKAILDDPARGFALELGQATLWSAVVAARLSPSPDAGGRLDHALHAAIEAPAGNVRLVIELLAREKRVDDAFAFIDGLPPSLRDDLPTEVLFESITEPLREDPRFMTLAAHHGLIAIWNATGHWPDFCSARLPYDCRTEAARALSSDPRPLLAAEAAAR